MNLKITLFNLLLFIGLNVGHAQTLTVKMLVDSVNSAWPVIDTLSMHATNNVLILSPNISLVNKELLDLQKPTSTPIGAVVYHTGGIIVDNGWIRIFGSGSDKFKRTLQTWNANKNKGKAFKLIADDAIGGHFALNYGEFGSDTGSVYYFSPKTLKNKSLNMDYGQFLKFCFQGNLDKFYTGMRWKTWRADVANLNTDSSFLFLPFLWNGNARNLDASVRKIIPAEQKYMLTQQEIRKIGSIK